MEDAKLQALHDSLAKLRGGHKSGLGQRSSGSSSAPYSWSNSNRSDQQLVDASESSTGHPHGLPNNQLYAYFAPEGTFNPSQNQPHSHGDGRFIKRNFDDIQSDNDSSSTSQNMTKEERKAKKKAAAKEAKKEAKRQAKLLQKKLLRKLQKQESSLSDRALLENTNDNDNGREEPGKSTKPSKQKDEQAKDSKNTAGVTTMTSALGHKPKKQRTEADSHQATLSATLEPLLPATKSESRKKSKSKRDKALKGSTDDSGKDKDNAQPSQKELKVSAKQRSPNELFASKIATEGSSKQESSDVYMSTVSPEPGQCKETSKKRKKRKDSTEGTELAQTAHETTAATERKKVAKKEKRTKKEKMKKKKE
jgi:hypothetical protein